MRLTEFRRELDRQWEALDREAMRHKNSPGALAELFNLYERLDAHERTMADQVISDWIQSTNGRKRFDALALVDRFRIQAATFRLARLETELQVRVDPEAPYELAKVRRILERLQGGP